MESRFRAADNYISQKGFAHLPKIGDNIPAVFQPEGSITPSRVSPTFGQHASKLQEGDLVTGSIDIAHERVHMLPSIRDEGHAEQKKALEKYLISLKIIPPVYREGWTLDHDSNTAWLSAPLWVHYETYATILIAPSVQDSARIHDNLERDNSRRADIIKRGGTDPGRDENADWFEGTDGEYELVIISPAHFSYSNHPITIMHPITKKYTLFYPSKDRDGFLREESPTGPPLPPFRSRGEIDRNVPLNPILVNFAAVLRLRHLIRQDPMWGSTLDRHVIDVLQRVVMLHAAVLWDPRSSQEAYFIIEAPRPQPLLLRELPDWPPWSDETGTPTTALGRAFALLEEGFEALPDLG